MSFSEGKFFRGIILSGGPTHAASFIVGKVLEWNSFSVRLKEPLWNQRTPIQVQGSKGVELSFAIQSVNDLHWPTYRESELVFPLQGFHAYGLLDPIQPKDAKLIGIYEKTLIELYAQEAGIATGGRPPLQSV